MKKINTIMRSLLCAAAVVCGVNAYADTMMHVTPAEGNVTQLSEFLLTFDGSWWLEDRTAKFVVTGPEGVEIPKIYNYSLGISVGYMVYFEDDAVLTEPGEYTLKVPAGKFAVDGYVNEETVYHYTIVAEGTEPTVPDVYAGAVQVTPVQGICEQISEFTLTFDADVEVVRSTAISLINSEVSYPLAVTATANTLSIAVVDSPITDADQYTLRISAGALNIGGQKNADIVLNYVIEEGSGNVVQFPTYQVIPEPGTYKSIDDGIMLIFDTKEAITLARNSVFLTSASGEEYTLATEIGEGYIKITPLDENGAATAIDQRGNYSVIITMGAIRINGISNQEPIVFGYTITGEEANAETVLLSEDFNGDYTESFPYMYDADAHGPHPSISGLFYSNATGTTMPWWVCKDTNDAIDKFMASHSYYLPEGKSDDWLISKPLDIDSEGYVLQFDAQCVNVRGTQYISDLSLFITESLLDVQDMPEEPTHVFENVPYGQDIDMCEGDWTHYTYSLDEYAGKQIYINFVNRNDNRDILCIDNVKVSRQDPVEVTLLPYDAYCASETTEIGMTMEVTDYTGIHAWTVTLYADGDVAQSWSGEEMAFGATETFTAEVDLVLGSSKHFEWVVTATDCPTLRRAFTITGMAFIPVHRVFFEETTSLHCGNCPMGMYAVESLLYDPDLGDRVIPVSVHISALGYDPMATDQYYSYLPQNNAAPVLFVERDGAVDGLNPTHDCVYNPSNPYSFAHRIATRAAEHTALGIEVSAEWVIEGSDTTAVNCTATVLPAYNLEGVDYRVAFILTENNVGLDRNPYWIQENYLAGKDYEGRCGGWCDLPANVINARYHDVARSISNYFGHANSLPADMEAAQAYTYTHKVKIPDTNFDSNGYHLSDPIRRSNCEITAIVIDYNTGRVLNAARVPMSESALLRYTAADLVADLGGVSDAACDDDGPAVYYDMIGRQVANPRAGLYVRRTPTGAKVVKVSE